MLRRRIITGVLVCAVFCISGGGSRRAERVILTLPPFRATVMFGCQCLHILAGRVFENRLGSATQHARLYGVDCPFQPVCTGNMFFPQASAHSTIHLAFFAAPAARNRNLSHK